MSRKFTAFLIAVLSVPMVEASGSAHDVIMEPAPRPQRARVYRHSQHRAPRYRRAYDHQRRPRNRVVGFHATGGSRFNADIVLTGAEGALRLRPIPQLAVDLGVGIYAGTDIDDNDRFEVPLSADLLVFINPYDRVQFYLSGGGALSFAASETYFRERREFVYAGGRFGVGVEWRIMPMLAINADAKVYIRQRIDDNPYPEFFERTLREGNSAGGQISVGGTIYF